MELWQRREGRRLTVAAYRTIGGVQGALEHRANEVLYSFNEPSARPLRRIFLRLIQPGEGTEDTKRRASFGELVQAGPDSESVESVISRLAGTRLITTEGEPKTTGEVSVEVAHEALIRGWGRLRQWIDADRIGLRIHRQLTEAAREWETYGRESSLLYSGTRLAVAREWAEAHRDELNALETEFLAAGLTQSTSASPFVRALSQHRGPNQVLDLQSGQDRLRAGPPRDPGGGACCVSPTSSHAGTSPARRRSGQSSTRCWPRLIARGSRGWSPGSRAPTGWR